MPRNLSANRASRAALLLAGLASMVLTAGCSSSETTGSPATSAPSATADGLVRVAASFYPVAEAAARVGGDRVSVENLTPPGGGAHDLELTPRQVDDLATKQVVFYLSKGFQPQVEKAVNGLPADVRAVDVLEGIDLLQVQDQLPGTQGEVDGEVLEGGYDPHVWVDPLLQATIAQSVRDALVELDPAGSATYDRGLASYTEQLNALHGEFEAGLADCDSNVIVTSHRAFEYLAQRYGLTQISIAGITPDEEPDPRTLEAVAAAARENNVQVVFFEEQVPPDLARTVANEIGARTDALDPIETITGPDLDAGVDYASIQRDNLSALRGGLACR